MSVEDAFGPAVAEGEGSDRAARSRRVLAPLELAALRVVRRPGRSLVVAGGVALAIATLVGVSAGSVIVGDRALRHQLDQTPSSQRSFRVDEFGLAFSSAPAAGKAADRALGLLSARPPVRTVAFRELRLGPRLVRLTAIEHAVRWLAIRSGRMPAACRPSRCEVVVVGSKALPRQLSVPGLRVVVVGRASLRVPSILGGFALPSDATLVVASDLRGLSTLPELQSDFRTESWVVPLSPRDVRIWDVDRVLAHETRAQSLLEATDPAFELTAPDDAFLNGRREARVGERRLLLVGGEVAALLLGFAVLAAIGLRRTLLAEWRRLEERGARRAQLWTLVAGETGLAALAGALVGAALGAVVAIWAASRAGVGSGALAAHGLFTWQTIAVAAIAWVAASAVVAGSVRPPLVARAGPVRIADVVALGAVATAVVAASRGGVTGGQLADNGGSATLLLLFPALVCLAGALIAARVFRPLLRLIERAAPRRRPTIRLALLALARAPARTSVAVAFFVASLALALLAASYRATLARGIRDEAAYRVPLDYTVREGIANVGPLDAGSLERYRSLARGVEAYPVVRTFGDVPGVGTQFTTPVVLGLDPRAIAQVHGWRSDFGALPPARLAKLLGAQGTVHLAGVPLPRGTTGLGIAARRTGAEINLDVVIEKSSGDIVRISLTRAGSADAGRGPPVPRNGRVVALELSLTQLAAAEAAHDEAERSTNAGVEGTLDLGPLVAFAGSRRLGVVTNWRGWVGREGARRVAAKPARVRYALTAAQTALLRPREPTDGHPLPMLVSPNVARAATPGGLVTFEFGAQEVTGKVVAVAHRFPGAGSGGFALAEESHLQTALDGEAPGTGRPLELWLAARSAAARRDLGTSLRRPPFSSLDLSSRQGVEHELRSDTLSRSIAIALGAGGLIALALAVCGLWLIALGDVADERGELRDLETQGATPAELRRQIRLRAAILALVGVAGGLALGLVLASSVVKLVRVSASGTSPVPPLVREVGWPTVGIALVALIVLAAVLVEASVRRAVRETA
jgi:hypothetical protein